MCFKYLEAESSMSVDDFLTTVVVLQKLTGKT